MTPSTPSIADPGALLRSRTYLALLLLGALVGVPVATFAYFFLKFVGDVQKYVFTTLPADLGFSSQPSWWAIPVATLSGLLVALTIRFLPGSAGHKPAEGFKAGGLVRPIDLFGVTLAAFATLSLGIVLGPEAPLIAIGSGLGALAIHLVKRDAPAQAALVIGAAGSFAAVSTLLGSPLAAAFLLMEAAGLGGATMSLVLLPGLLAAGTGALIYVGLNDWTGYGTFSLAVPDLPEVGSPTVAQFFWAIAIGVLAAILGSLIRRGALGLQTIVELRPILLTPAVGAAVGICVFVFVESTDKGSSYVLYSGQDQLAPLIDGAANWTVGALIVLVACKGIAYSLSLSSFRGGPVFPGMFIGAAGGIALSHLPGLPVVAGAAMGIGAMTVAMLRLPFVSVLLVGLFLQTDGLALLPVVIVAVVVAHVISAHLEPPAPVTDTPEPAPA